MFTISMGAIGMDPTNPNVLYGGSGNLFDGGSAFTKNAGIYRSADAGLTWSIVDGGYFGTIFNNMGINRIVCPAADTLLVATNVGLFRSVDGGRNFGANPGAFNDRKPILAGKICTLLLDTDTPASTVYAGVAGVGLMMSTNAGISFPINLFSNTGAPAAGSYNSFVVAQSAFDGTTVNNNVFYASVQNTLPNGSQVYVGLYRSIDGGNFWVGPLTSLFGVAGLNDQPNTIQGWTPQFWFQQTNYDLTIGVDPLDSKRVYAGFQQLWLSVDGGANFLAKAVTDSQVHWDNHALVFSPATHRGTSAPTTLYTGTDGGIATSSDGGQTFKCINGQIATSLFRGIAIGKSNNAYTYGGCQDTGTSGHRAGDASGQWHAGINGDGWLVAVDPNDPTIVYGFDGRFFIKTTNAGGHWSATFDNPATIGKNLTNPAPPVTARAIALDQSGAVTATRTVYVSEGNLLYQSGNAGLTFAKTSLPPTSDIMCIVTTAAAAGTVWVGTNDGSVHKSTDAAGTWDSAPFVSTPGGAGINIGPVNHIAVDGANPLRVAAVYGGVSGIHSKFRTRHVFLSQDGGASWNDVSGTDGAGPVGNLPDLPLRSVVFDTRATPSALIVAGDSGVLRTINATITGTGDAATGSATWKIYGVGLPMVCCNSLAIDNSANPTILRVGTYGRSCFEISKPAGPNFAIDSNLAFGAVAVGQPATLTCYVYNCGDAALIVSSTAIVGTAPFAFEPTPALPVTLNPGDTQPFQVTFTPSAPGDAFVLLEFNTNDATQATRLIPASGTGVNTGLAPRLASNPIQSIGFGKVTTGSDRSIAVQLFNVGTAPLNISAINSVSGSNDFTLSPAPTFPVVVAAGGEVDVTFKFSPTAGGPITATFNVVWDDPTLTATLVANGTGNQATASFWTSLLQKLGLGHP
jgi:hypothetical protein